jgi:hypothetical protein
MGGSAGVVQYGIPIVYDVSHLVVYVDGEGRIRMRSETYPVEPNTPSLYARSISATH